MLSQTEVLKDLCPYISLTRHMLVTHGNVEISKSALYIERVYLQLRNEVSMQREVGISRKNKKKIEHGLRRLSSNLLACKSSTFLTDLSPILA